jgi:hypothetical protein
MNRQEMLNAALQGSALSGHAEPEGFKLDDEPTRVAYGMNGHYTEDEISAILSDVVRVQAHYDRLCREAADAERRAAHNKVVAEQGGAELARIMGDRKPKQVYVGRNQGCRCGCGGNYHDAGSAGLKASLTRLARMLGAGEATWDGDTDSSYTNFSYGDNRAVTIYFTE